MTATLENSTTQLQFNYAENLGDGRGITFGCIGFCTGTYDGNILIKHYTELNPDNTLAKYIPALDKIDSGSHDAADWDGKPSVEGLSGFIQDVNACDDPLFKKAQMDKLDELYYDPAMEIANSIGVKNALTKAFIYDMCVRHGTDGAEDIIKAAGTLSNDENTFLLKLISLRDAELKREGLGDVDRDQGFKNVLNSGNVNLKTPFTFVAYGDDFTIDGNLDIGDSEKMVTVTDKNIYTTKYKDCETNDCKQKSETIKGQEGKQVVIDLVSLSLAAPPGGLATAWCIADVSGEKTQLCRFTVNSSTYQPLSVKPAFFAPAGKDVTLNWFLKSSSTIEKAKMKLLSYDYSLEDIQVIEDPTEPETPETPEEPEIKNCIMIVCNSAEDVNTLTESIKSLVGDREIIKLVQA